MTNKIGLTRKELLETQSIRKQIRKNNNIIRKTLSENENLYSQLVRVCFKLSKECQ